MKVSRTVDRATWSCDCLPGRSQRWKSESVSAWIDVLGLGVPGELEMDRLLTDPLFSLFLD